MYGWRLAIFGLGVLAGAIGASVMTCRNVSVKDGATTVLSHGLALKRKACAVVETARENIDDLVAEADHKLQVRQAASPEENKD